MKLKFTSIIFAALAFMIAPVSHAQVSISVGVGADNSCGYPYYQSCSNYYPPAVVYVGDGYWGGHYYYEGRRRGDDRRHFGRRGHR